MGTCHPTHHPTQSPSHLATLLPTSTPFPFSILHHPSSIHHSSTHHLSSTHHPSSTLPHLPIHHPPTKHSTSCHPNLAAGQVGPLVGPLVGWVAFSPICCCFGFCSWKELACCSLGRRRRCPSCPCARLQALVQGNAHKGCPLLRVCFFKNKSVALSLKRAANAKLMCAADDRRQLLCASPCFAVLQLYLPQAACIILQHGQRSTNHSPCTRLAVSPCTRLAASSCTELQAAFFIFFVQFFPFCKDGSFGGTLFLALGQQFLHQCLVADFQEFGSCSCAGNDQSQAGARTIWHVLDVGLVFPTTKLQRWLVDGIWATFGLCSWLLEWGPWARHNCPEGFFFIAF